jgi:hypothetical protein
MAILIATAIVLCLIIGFTWVTAKRRGALFVWDYATVLGPVPVWYALAAAGVGSNSMGNLLEIPVVLLLGAVMFALRVFVFDRALKSPTRASFATFVVTLALVVMVRLFMPNMPE